MRFKLLPLHNVICTLTLFLIASVSLNAPEVSHAAFGYRNNSSSSNLWVALRHQFQLQDATRHPLVRKQIKWLVRHKEYLYKLSAQAAPYLRYVYQETKKRNLPGELALLPMIESAYDPFAYSRVGAAGLWQLMPGTASGLGLKQNWWYDGRRDIHASTKAALNYLAYLNRFFNGNWLYALAAYDAGAGTVQKAITRNIKERRPTDFWSLALPRETREYLPRLLALAAIIHNPRKYHVSLATVYNRPYFTRIKISHQINLAKVAKLAHMNERELYLLNPGYNRWATEPDNPASLVLPIDKLETFNRNKQSSPKSFKVVWKRHLVKKGDTLSKIAQLYETTVSLLKKINKLNNELIYIGNQLLVPAMAQSLDEIEINQERKTLHKKIKKFTTRKRVYTVKHGDTISRISNRYHVKPAALRFWNQLKNNNIIPGQRLIIWKKLKKTA